MSDSMCILVLSFETPMTMTISNHHKRNSEMCSINVKYRGTTSSCEHEPGPLRGFSLSLRKAGVLLLNVGTVGVVAGAIKIACVKELEADEHGVTVTAQKLCGLSGARTHSVPPS